MKCFYALLIGLTISTTAWAQVLKTETDAKTGKEIRAAVTLLGNGMGQQLNFFSRGNEMLIEFVEGRAIEGWPAKILSTMSINIQLKNDSTYRFPIDVTKYTEVNTQLMLRLSIVAVLTNNQLKPLLASQVRSISLGFGSGKDLQIPPISDNNRREIKRAVAYILGEAK